MGRDAPSLVRFAVGEARDDAALALAEVRRCGVEELPFISERLRADQAFLLELLRLHDDGPGVFSQEAGYICRQLSPALRRCALAAVRVNWTAFCYLDDAQKGGDVLRAALSITGRALDAAPEAARATRDLVRFAAEHGGPCAGRHGHSFDFAGVSEKLRGDRDLVTECMTRARNVFFTASATLRADLQVALVAVRACPEDLRWASEALRANKSLVLAAVKQGPGGLKHASEDLRKDPEVVAAAVGRARDEAKHALMPIRQALESVPTAEQLRNQGCLSVEEWHAAHIKTGKWPLTIDVAKRLAASSAGSLEVALFHRNWMDETCTEKNRPWLAPFAASSFFAPLRVKLTWSDPSKPWAAIFAGEDFVGVNERSLHIELPGGGWYPLQLADGALPEKDLQTGRPLGLGRLAWAELPGSRRLGWRGSAVIWDKGDAWKRCVFWGNTGASRRLRLRACRRRRGASIARRGAVQEFTHPRLPTSTILVERRRRLRRESEAWRAQRRQPRDRGRQVRAMLRASASSVAP